MDLYCLFLNKSNEIYNNKRFFLIIIKEKKINSNNYHKTIELITFTYQLYYLELLLLID